MASRRTCGSPFFQISIFFPSSLSSWHASRREQTKIIPIKMEKNHQTLLITLQTVQLNLLIPYQAMKKSRTEKLLARRRSRYSIQLLRTWASLRSCSSSGSWHRQARILSFRSRLVKSLAARIFHRSVVAWTRRPVGLASQTIPSFFRLFNKTSPSC